MSIVLSTGFSNVVAEELYSQRTTSPQRRRVLRSEYLLVRYPGAEEWHSFRDVLEVDGKPVRDGRQEQIVKLFLESPVNAVRRAEEIARAGSGYNLRCWNAQPPASAACVPPGHLS